MVGNPELTSRQVEIQFQFPYHQRALEKLFFSDCPFLCKREIQHLPWRVTWWHKVTSHLLHRRVFLSRSGSITGTLCGLWSMCCSDESMSSQPQNLHCSGPHNSLYKVYYSVFSSNCGLYALDASSTPPRVLRNKLSLGGQSHHQLRTTWPRAPLPWRFKITFLEAHSFVLLIDETLFFLWP